MLFRSHQSPYFAGGIDVKPNEEYNTKKGLHTDFLFTVDNPLSLDITDTGEIVKGSVKDITLKLTNNLPSGKVILKVIQSPQLVTSLNLPESRIEKEVSNGLNTLSFKADTSYLGINKFTVQSFYSIKVNGREEMFPSNTWVFFYNVVETLSGQPSEVDVTESGDNKDTVVFPPSKSNIIGIIAGVLGGLAILYILFK